MSIKVKIVGDHIHAGKTGTIPTSVSFEKLPAWLLKVEFDPGQETGGVEGSFVNKKNLEVNPCQSDNFSS